MAPAKKTPKRAPRTKESLVSLTIFLAKSGVTEGDAIDDSRKEAKTSDIELENKKLGTLYIRQSPIHQPTWAKFFAGQQKVRPTDLKTAAASAVLLTKVQGRLFAVVFGYGRHLLHLDKFEARFGLRVTLNGIDPQLVRAVDTTSLESNPLFGKRQASKATSIREFGIDVDRDLLRGATGRPQSEALGTMMSGADALSVRAAVNLRGLHGLLAKYLGLHRKSTYRERGLGWVDHVAEVRDKSRIEALDAELVAVIRSQQDSGSVWAAVPEAIDWPLFDNFRIGSRKSASCYDDISLERLTPHLNLRALSIDDLKQMRVRCVARDGESEMHSWTFHRCIGAEIEHKGQLFILNAGAWYVVARDFASEIDDYVRNRIAESTAALAPWGDENEDAYNRRVAEQSRGAFINMDRKLIKHSGMSSQIEFCDLLSMDGLLMHVKRFSQSSVLSHLFSQGAVSAQLLVGDPDFRRAINERLGRPLFVDPDVDVDRARYEVCFVIGGNHTDRRRLPFFSKITLRNAHRSIVGPLGLRASLKMLRIDRLASIT